MSIQKTIRIPEELNEFLETHAEKNKRSFSKTVEYLLEVGKKAEKK